jgi:hypothetical protein
VKRFPRPNSSLSSRAQRQLISRGVRRERLTLESVVKPIGLVAPRLQALGLSTLPARETYHGGQEDLDQSARPEGAMFVDYVATQSCASGRNAFFTGMFPCAPA